MPLSDSFCCLQYMLSPRRCLCFVYLCSFKLLGLEPSGPPQETFHSFIYSFKRDHTEIQFDNSSRLFWCLLLTYLHHIWVSWLQLLSCTQIAFFLLKETPSNKSLCITQWLRSTCLYCLELAQAATWISLDQAGVLQYPISLSFSILIATPPSLLRVITGCQWREDDSGSCILHTDEK